MKPPFPLDQADLPTLRRLHTWHASLYKTERGLGGFTHGVFAAYARKMIERVEAGAKR